MAAKTGRFHATPMLFLLTVFLLNSPMFHAKEERQLLLSFRASINDPLQYISNWNPSSTFCKWEGITCNYNSSSQVNQIELSGKNISGKISSSSIFQLPYIERIDLSSNQLSGELPHDMFTCSSLRYLNLSNNNLTGPMPSGWISRLESLDLSNNMLSGKIPPGIGSFSSLKFLDLGGNVFVGEIPVTITNVTSLQVFTLASNRLTGRIPRELGRMRSLKWIYLGYNNLSGEIPREIGQLTSLNHLDIVYNNLTGEIPSSFGNLTDLRYLFLYQNKLTGSIPESIFGLQKLISLDLSDNSLSGEIPELLFQLQNLEIFQLFSNNFTGKIPAALTSLPRLQVLQLWSNNFSGEIPKDLGKKNNLTVLDLSTNSFAGKIPESLCSSGNLFKLILFSNSLEGRIPDSLGSCKSLKRVRLQNNKLSGEISSQFTKLPLVYFLDISGNNLSGRIDQKNWEMPSLQMLSLAGNRFYGGLPDSFGSEKLENLDLSQNEFSGTIPGKFGNLSELMQLKLSGNRLSGEIPEELGYCKKLVSLDLSKNGLTGGIPNTFSEMPVLGKLDLSQNQLSGQIPRNLGRVESLVQVNISHNLFQGSLPSTGAFLAINATAVAGNSLCGGDAASGLPPCRGVKGPTWWVFIVCFLGVMLLLGMVAFFIVFVRGRRDLELKRVENEDGVWELQFFHSKKSMKSIISIDDILSSMKEGKGKSAANDTPFVVKEINDVGSLQPRFWPEVREFGSKVHHPNVVKLIGTCRSNKCAYLVYECVQGGKNLSEILRNLSWDRRRKIATGIGKALWYLHSSCSPCVLVGYVSPEIVVVDEKDVPRLRLSLPFPLCVDTKCLVSSAYVAPETRESKEVTEKSDIYGFGLILIELLTGKSPADPEFGLHENIVEWARYCYADCLLESWIDPKIKENVFVNQNEIVETMNLALHCTATDPMARPCAIDVSRALHCAFRTGSCVSSSALKLSVFN